MKDLKDIKLQLEAKTSTFSILRELEYEITDKALFKFPLDDGNNTGFCVRVNVENWEHVWLDLEENQRCATYEEMCQLKETFFDETEITLQVYPKKSEYVNERSYRLHLWRSESITPQAEARLKRRITTAYEEAKKYDIGSKGEVFLGNYQVLAIFCGEDWLPWEEICKIKQRYWKPEETVVQFNVSPELDLNKEHMILLWDATNFDLPLMQYV